VQQIQQYETQLKRMGDMANVKNLVGFSEFASISRSADPNQNLGGQADSVDGRGLFGDTRGGVFPEITLR
jgi:hypothetical protein